MFWRTGEKSRMLECRVRGREQPILEATGHKSQISSDAPKWKMLNLYYWEREINLSGITYLISRRAFAQLSASFLPDSNRQGSPSALCPLSTDDSLLVLNSLYFGGLLIVGDMSCT